MYERRSIFCLSFRPAMRYPEAIRAPPRARISPQAEWVDWAKSESPITIAPVMVKRMARVMKGVTLSLKIRYDPSPTKTGWMFTMTTELATDVYFREAIQKAKWRAKKIPVRKSSFHRPRRISPYLPGVRRAIGARMREARPSR
jgi:hypothetical protein